jgi:hypothetical protein
LRLPLLRYWLLDIDYQQPQRHSPGRCLCSFLFLVVGCCWLLVVALPSWRPNALQAGFRG